jgi:hypothetical protein
MVHRCTLRKSRHRRLRFAIALLTLTALLGPLASTGAAATSGTTYYVDCVNGNDGASGADPASAWQTLARANDARLAAGDQLLLARGCVWTGPLTVTDSGADGNPIVVDAYGDGALPTIQNAPAENVILSGSWVVVAHLATRADAPAVELGCDNQPVGWRSGFRIEGAHDVVRDSSASNLTAGVVIAQGAHDNQVLNNVLTDNNMMSRLDDQPHNDSGAFGVLLQGDGNEIAYNRISGSDACSYDYGRDGAAVEVYGGSDNDIHDNVATNNQAFSELGYAGIHDNTYAYNVVTSTLPTSAFIITRGAGSSYGPIYRTRLYNNSVLLTGEQSQGFVCDAGCDASILILRDNVIQAVAKAGYADGAVDGDYNLYWGGQCQFALGAHDLIADPQFVSQTDLRLRPSSPGVDSGVGLGFGSDLLGVLVPSGAGVDRGAYEVGSGDTALAQAPGEHILNGSFNADDWFSGWRLQVYAGAQAGVSSDQGSAEVTVTQAAPDNPFYAQLMQAGIALVAGGTYTLSFIATASSPRDIQVVVQQDDVPYTLYASQTTPLTTDWTTVTLTFTAPAGVSDAFVGVNLAQQTGSVWIDHVSLTGP